MNTESIKSLLENSLKGSIVIVEGQDCSLSLTIICDEFTGLLPIKRQQLVYSYLNELISSGVLHAVSMKTYTHKEWQSNKAS